MKRNLGMNLVTGLVSAILATMLLFPSVAAAGDRQPQETVVALSNNTFETPALLMNTWTGNVPGWYLLPNSAAGVWRPGSGYFAREFGSNILWINYGGVLQNLPITFQPSVKYTFSVQWGYRKDTGLGGLALQLVAGQQVLATCAPQSAQAQGEFSTVTLVYRGRGWTRAVGQPLSVRIVMLSGGGNTRDNGQLDVKNPEFTVTDARDWWEHDSSKEECSIDYSSNQ